MVSDPSWGSLTLVEGRLGGWTYGEGEEGKISPMCNGIGQGRKKEEDEGKERSNVGETRGKNEG